MNRFDALFREPEAAEQTEMEPEVQETTIRLGQVDYAILSALSMSDRMSLDRIASELSDDSSIPSSEALVERRMAALKEKGWVSCEGNAAAARYSITTSGFEILEVFDG